MSYKILNGYGKPGIVIQNKDSKINSIVMTLDRCCIEGGLAESYQPSFQRTVLDYKDTIVDHSFKGNRINFKLDYSFCTSENLAKIEIIEKHWQQPDDWLIFLQPRTIADGGRVFEVRLEGIEWGQKIIRNEANSEGHSDVQISFLTTYTETNLRFIDSNNTYMRSYFHYL